jgi:hypothetical protein
MIPSTATIRLKTAPYIVRHKRQTLIIPNTKPVIAIPLPGSGTGGTYIPPG